MNPNNEPRMNPTAIQILKERAMKSKRENYPNVPPHDLPDTKFNDTTSNGLTSCVISWLTLNKHYCSRIQSQGQWNQKLGMFTKSTVRKGIADIMAVIEGRTVMIEIKIGRDKLSEAQIKTKHDVEKSGGHYMVVKDFDSFLQQYKQLTDQI
jgi:hypothetical protein